MEQTTSTRKKLNFRSSLMARLLLIMVLIAMVPLLGIQIATFVQLTNTTHAEIERGLSNGAAQQTQYILSWADERMQDIQTLAALPAIQTFDPKQGQSILNQYKDNWGSTKHCLYSIQMALPFLIPTKKT